MSQVAPGGAYTSRLVLGSTFTGLAGTLRFRLLDNDATVNDPVYGPSTANIIEDPTTTGVYLFRGTAPSTQGMYDAFWDRGVGTELIPDLDRLVVTSAPIAPADPGNAFALASDIEARFGITFTDAEETRAETLIGLATLLIQQEVGQHVLLVEDDEITFIGQADQRLRLPERPVVSVESVHIDETLMVEGTDYIVDGDTLVRYAGWNKPPSAGWGIQDETITVVYTHGFATVPGSVRAVCIEMVARVWANPGSVQQEMYGSIQVAYANPGVGLTLTDAERRVVRDAIRRNAGTVTLA